MINSFDIEEQKNIIQPSDDSILILGKGNKEYNNLNVFKVNSIAQSENLFGENSELTLAFKEAYEIGARNIYMCNCFKYTDYLTVLTHITNQEYAYITPLFNFFDKIFYKNNNREMYLSEIYSNIFSERLTQLIFTDKHASLYENISHYIKDNNNKLIEFKDKSFEHLQYGQNICFILNNLEKYKYANIALASILVQNNLKDYPQKDVGDVIFDIRDSDLYGEIAYFAYDIVSKTTVENFLNFHKKQIPEKFVPIFLIIQKIKRQLDFSEYAGSLFSAYQKIILENKVNTILNSFVNKIIESYRIEDILVVPNEDNATVTIYILIAIKPYNSIEEINIKLEV